MKLVRLLLPINERGTSQSCAETAFGLARRFGVRLEILHACLAAWQRLPYATELSPYYFQELINAGSEQVVCEKDEAKAWTEQMAAAFAKTPADFVSAEGLIAPTIAMRARVCDLTIVPSIHAQDDNFWGSVRDGALFSSGRPMLAVPQGASSDFGETVVIAWKDSAEATRAVTAAAPFLADAKRVRLLSVDEGDEQDQSLASMADYLAMTGLEVEAAKIDPAGREIGEALLQEANMAERALLVMGAYGHWRWKQWAFGGVTQYVLRNTPMPVLMMH